MEGAVWMMFDSVDEICAKTLACPDEEEIARLLQEWLEVAAAGHSARFQAVDDNGELLAPDAYYVIDALLNYFELWSESSVWELTGGLGVATFMVNDESCDVCKDERARYDSMMRPSDGWAYMCGSCYRLNSDRVLGTGVGQYLIYPGLDTGIYIDMFKHIHAVKFGSYS